MKKGEIVRYCGVTANTTYGYLLILEKPVDSGYFCPYCEEQETKARYMALNDSCVYVRSDLCKCFELLGEKK